MNPINAVDLIPVPDAGQVNVWVNEFAAHVQNVHEKVPKQIQESM